jgi:transglutaminase-like putative cysteine protease
LLASLPWTLAALGFALLAHLPFLPIWIIAAFVLCGAARYVIEHRRLRLPPAWFRAFLALTCFIGVLATYSTVSGVGPGSALLAIMASLKLLETRKRRDQYVLLFICIFLVMASLLRDQYLWSLPYLGLSILIILTAWLRLSAGPRLRPRNSIATAGRLLAYAAPLAIAMWILFPRLASPFWGVPIDTSRGTSGLSDTMSPGDISSLSMSGEVAFRVRFDGAAPAPRDRYWRGLVLHEFSGRSWSGREPSIDRNAVDRIEYLGDPIKYEITIEPTAQRWVFALELPQSWSLQNTFMSAQQQLARITPIDQKVSYEVTSYTNYRADAELRSFFRNWYEQLPPGSNERTRQLATDMRAMAGSDKDYITAVLDMFRNEEFFYTLQPPPLGSNPVDRFLFETRRGFCEHYASAFTVMMRAVGIPARVVLGYQGGQINPMGDHMVVRQSDAHAWTEVWFEGDGWQRVDPTGAVAPERIEYGISEALSDGIGESWGFTAPSALRYQLEMAYDVLNAKWDEWVLGYGPEAQQKLMRLLGMSDPSWRKMLLTLVFVVISIVLLISYLLYRRYQPPPRDAASILYQRFLRKVGLQPTVGETPRNYATRAGNTGKISAESIDSVTAAYMDARYGPAGKDAISRLQQEVARAN